jgi:4-nitrophenyl phosphatase
MVGAARPTPCTLPGVLLLVDLDGVVYRGSEPVPGIAALLGRRVAAGDEVVYVTNNSMWFRADYVERLESMGAPVSLDRVVSSPRATALYLRELEPAIGRVLVLGGPGLARELTEAGFAVTLAGEAVDHLEGAHFDRFAAAGRPDAVVVGLDPELTWERLAVAVSSIRAGARFVVTNRDPIYPTERGLMPGAGAIVAAVEAASGRMPVSIGKPAPLLLEEAARLVGVSPADAVMIGDSLRTDLPAARAVGARCVLMLTGVTGQAEVEALPADERPDAVANDAAELERALDRLRAESPSA